MRMKNIKILATLKEQVETVDFMMEDLAVCVSVDDAELAELFQKAMKMFGAY